MRFFLFFVAVFVKIEQTIRFQEKTMKNKIILVRKVEEAQVLATKFRENKQLFATVEAEYGDVCIEGNWKTLAHHTLEHRHNPAPCVRKDVLPLEGGIILISHLDLDTLGGIMLLEGEPLMTDSFWESEALIDTQGVLAEALLSERDRYLMRAYWAWETKLPDQTFLSNPAYQVLDVTDSVALRISFVNMMLKPLHTTEEQQLLAAHYQVFQQDLEAFLSTCVYQTEHLRVFISQENQHYLSHYHEEKLLETCVTLNQAKGTLTISDLSPTLDCKAFMQRVFGENAGGQFRVAGSPRDQRMTMEDLRQLLEQLYIEKNWSKEC